MWLQKTTSLLGRWARGATYAHTRTHWPVWLHITAKKDLGLVTLSQVVVRTCPCIDCHDSPISWGGDKASSAILETQLTTCGNRSELTRPNAVVYCDSHDFIRHVAFSITPRIKIRPSEIANLLGGGGVLSSSQCSSSAPLFFLRSHSPVTRCSLSLGTVALLSIPWESEGAEMRASHTGGLK